MTEEKLADLFTTISGHIASIDAKLTVFVEKLADHERRLCEIEHPSTPQHGGLVATLAKAIVYMAAALAAGAGASGILSKIGG